MWRFWVDRRGTFTDIVARRPDGSLHSHKLLSENPERYEDAAVQSVGEMLGLKADEPIPKDMIEAVKMGTTVATTSVLLERKGDRTALPITRGMRDLPRIGHRNRPRLFDLEIVLPELLHEETVEIDERVDAEGNVVTPLDPRQVRDALRGAHGRGFRSASVADLFRIVGNLWKNC